MEGSDLIHGVLAMNIICYMHILQTVIWDSHEDVKEDTYTNLQLLLQRLFLNSARAAFHDSQFRNDPYLPFTRPRHSLSVHHLPETSYSFQPPSTSLYVCFYWFSHLTRIDLDSSQVWLLCFILIWLWGDHTSAITDITQSQGQINKKKEEKTESERDQRFLNYDFLAHRNCLALIDWLLETTCVWAYM